MEDVDTAKATSITETVGSTKQLTGRARCNRALGQVVGAASRKKWAIDDKAAELITSYSIGLANKILEDAAVLAKHRNATEIDATDVNLILIKKHNIVMPPFDGVKRVTLHRDLTKTSHSAPKIVVNAETSAVAAAAAQDIVELLEKEKEREREREKEKEKKDGGGAQGGGARKKRKA